MMIPYFWVCSEAIASNCHSYKYRHCHAQPCQNSWQKLFLPEQSGTVSNCCIKLVWIESHLLGLVFMCFLSLDCALYVWTLHYLMKVGNKYLIALIVDIVTFFMLSILPICEVTWYKQSWCVPTRTTLPTPLTVAWSPHLLFWKPHLSSPYPIVVKNLVRASCLLQTCSHYTLPWSRQKWFLQCSPWKLSPWCK